MSHRRPTVTGDSSRDRGWNDDDDERAASRRKRGKVLGAALRLGFDPQRDLPSACDAATRVFTRVTGLGVPLDFARDFWYDFNRR